MRNFHTFLQCDFTDPADGPRSPTGYKNEIQKKVAQKAIIIGDDVGESIVDINKSVTMKTVTEFVAEAWSEIQAITLLRS